MINELEPCQELKWLPVRKAYSKACQLLRARERESGHVLSPEARIFLSLATFDGEVSNGGLAQYFTNSSGAQYRQLLEALQALRMTPQSRILERWLLLLPEGMDPGNRRAVGDYLFRHEDQLKRSKELDMEYYRTKDAFLAHLLRWALE